MCSWWSEQRPRIMTFRPSGFSLFSGLFESIEARFGFAGAGEYIKHFATGDVIEIFIDDLKRGRWASSDVNAYMLLQTDGSSVRLRFRTSATPQVELMGPTDNYVIADDGDGQLILQGDNITLGKNATQRPPLALAMTNSSGGTLSAGDVVILDTSNDDSVTSTTTANSKEAFIVVEGAADTETVWVATMGKVSDAAADATAISRGDTLVTSTTAGQLTVNNSQTDPGRIIGYALTTKSAGAGPVDVLMRR